MLSWSSSRHASGVRIFVTGLLLDLVDLGAEELDLLLGFAPFELAVEELLLDLLDLRLELAELELALLDLGLGLLAGPARLVDLPDEVCELLFELLLLEEQLLEVDLK